MREAKAYFASLVLAAVVAVVIFFGAISFLAVTKTEQHLHYGEPNVTKTPQISVHQEREYTDARLNNERVHTQDTKPPRGVGENRLP